MTHRITVPLLAVLMAFAGCSEDFEPAGGDTLVRFSCSIGESGTRTSMSGSTASFTSGDKIGVSDSLLSRRNVQFSFNGSAWSTTTPMYWFNGTSTDAFYAYYPYNATNQGNVVTIPVLNNQTFTTTPDPSCDLLVAIKRQARTAGTSVGLTFTHAFSLLQFNITAPLISTYSFQAMTLNGGNTAGGAAPYGIVNIVNATSQVGYDISSRKLSYTAANNTASTFSQTIQKSIPSPGIIGIIPITVYAVVLPGQYSNPIPNVTFRVSKLTGTKDTSPVNLTNSTFLPGNKYIYNVQIGGLIGLRAPDVRLESVLPFVLGDEIPESESII